MTKELVVAVTGASGAVLARSLLEFLRTKGIFVHLTISEQGAEIVRHELSISCDIDDARTVLEAFYGETPENVAYYRYTDLSAPITSGTYKTSGMVVIPCSMNTMAAIANGLSGNLIERAADVTLKEGRKLILVPRETPLSGIHLRNMLKLSQVGACILPAMPAFYLRPASVDDMVNYVVGKVLDQLDIEHNISPRWE